MTKRKKRVKQTYKARLKEAMKPLSKEEADKPTNWSKFKHILGNLKHRKFTVSLEVMDTVFDAKNPEELNKALEDLTKKKEEN